MQTVKLSIFDNFKCLASDCKDSCCNAGWQIDVDKKTMQKYSLCDGTFVQKIRDNIEQIDKQYCIKCHNGKCPFFRDDGLCDIVKNKGDGFLGEVCRNFPRINNYVAGRREQTLSFACEEVVRQVLNQYKITFVYENIKKDVLLKDKAFAIRDDLINYVQNKELSFSQKIEHLIQESKYYLTDFEKMKSLLKSCEWLKTDISNFDFEEHIKPCQKNFALTDNQLENVFVCFIFRYLINNEYKYSLNARLRFCIFSILLCDYLVLQNRNKKIDDSEINAIKEYSREIENSSKNVNFLLNFFNFQ